MRPFYTGLRVLSAMGMGILGGIELSDGNKVLGLILFQTGLLFLILQEVSHDS